MKAVWVKKGGGGGLQTSVFRGFPDWFAEAGLGLVEALRGRNFRGISGQSARICVRGRTLSLDFQFQNILEVLSQYHRQKPVCEAIGGQV